jgi:hypothetical protein
MLNWLDEFLDKTSYWSIQALIWIGVSFWILFFVILIGSQFFEDDPIVGETYHGVIIRESDLEKEENE